MYYNRRQKERVCRYVYNKVLTPECIQWNGTDDSWLDANDEEPQWSNTPEYSQFFPDWLISLNDTNDTFLSSIAPTGKLTIQFNMHDRLEKRF